MNNQNKELLYSVIFLIAGFVWLTFNPFSQIRDLSDSAYSVLNVMVLGFFFFIILSLYFSIKAIRNPPKDVKKIFGFIPNNIPSGLAFIVFLLSAILMVYVTLLLTGVINY